VSGATRVDPSFLELALNLADAAGPIVRKYFRNLDSVDDKADASPVTVADREVETAMRALIKKNFPDHGILGEELGSDHIDAEYVWVLDPIDGTKAFVTGKPLFGTLIALTRHGVPIIGIIDQPVLKERWVGVAGEPSRLNGQAIRTRACGALKDAWMYATTPLMFVDDDAPCYERLSKAVKHPLYGADCYAYGLLACGWADLVCEASLKPYDWCALVPVIEGAGGHITDWEGRPLTISSTGRVLAAGNAALHQMARHTLLG